MYSILQIYNSIVPRFSHLATFWQNKVDLHWILKSDNNWIKCVSSYMYIQLQCRNWKDSLNIGLTFFQGVESVVMLPKGINCPGCENKEKEYFITAGSKGTVKSLLYSPLQPLKRSLATLPISRSLLHRDVHSFITVYKSDILLEPISV